MSVRRTGLDTASPRQRPHRTQRRPLRRWGHPSQLQVHCRSACASEGFSKGDETRGYTLIEQNRRFLRLYLFYMSTRTEKVPICNLFLDEDERFYVFNVKLAERPHLAKYVPPSDSGDDTSNEQQADDNDETSLPLSDGCDIPGWRQEELIPLGNEVFSVLNVGIACPLRRRESQLVPFLLDPQIEWKKQLPLPHVQRGGNGVLDAVPRIDIREACEVIHDDVTGRSVTQFALQYEKPNIPVLVENSTTEWPAATKWSIQSFHQRFQNVNWRFSDLHGEMMTLGTYSKYSHGMEGMTDDSPLAIYDSEFGNEQSPTSCLLDEYTVPACFSPDLFDCVLETVDCRPPYRWILLGPSRSGTGMHIDPLYTNAWVTLLEGRKHWMLFPPHAPHEEIGMHHEPALASVVWFQRYYDSTIAAPQKKNWKPVEIVQEPGETVFVPCGWPHVVLNLKPSLAVTHNYACEFHLDKVMHEVKQHEPEFYKLWIPALKQKRPDLFSK